MAHHRKHSKISSEPADATRREGPAPDFEFVRPYVASIAEQPAEPPGQPSPADATAELTLRLLTVGQRPAVPETDDGPGRRSRARYLMLAAAMVLILIAAGVFVFRSPHSAPADASSQPAPATSTAPVGAIATVDAPTSEPTALPTDTSTSTTTTTTTTHTGSSHPSAHPTASSNVSAQPSTDRPSRAPGNTVVASGQIVGIGGMCVDDNGRITPNGNPIQLYGCNATPAQAWTFMGDGTLRVLGKCLQVTQPAQAGLTELWDCDGSPTEVWRGGPGNEFVNVATGLCLDSPNLSTAQGTQLQIWQCNGGTNQSWVFQ